MWHVGNMQDRIYMDEIPLHGFENDLNWQMDKSIKWDV